NAVRELNNYKENRAIVDYVYLYYHDDDKVYSSSGTHSLSTLQNETPPCIQWSKQAFTEKINTEKQEVRVHKKKPDKKSIENMMVSLHPVPKSSPQPFGKVMYTIKQSVLTNQIEDILGDYQGNTYIIDQDGELVAAPENHQEIEK